MNQLHSRICADVSSSTRAQLLRMFPPRFSQVFCKSVTWAYRVTDEFEFSPLAADIKVYGHHQTDEHEALLVDLGGHRLRPDGKRLFLTLSTAHGVEPAKAGEIVERNIRKLDYKVIFTTQLRRVPLWVQAPEIMAGLAAA